MEEPIIEGVKFGETTPPVSPTGDKQPEGSEPVKTPGEQADELLSGSEKRILVDKDRFNERNDKAKLYEAHAPLLDKVLQNPALVEELLETKSKEDLSGRLTRLEEEKKAEKRSELRQAITEALTRWPDFKQSWTAIQPVSDLYYKQGYSYKEALRKAYIAEHPEAAQAEAERITKERANQTGEFAQGASYASQPAKIYGKVKLAPAEQVVAEMAVKRGTFKSVDDYATALEKHRGTLEAKGFYNPALEIELK